VFGRHGGLAQPAQWQPALQPVPGVRVGRAAWHTPGVLSALSVALGQTSSAPDDQHVLNAMMQYAARQTQAGVPLRMVIKGMLGWQSGRPGARRWRQTLSDARQLTANDPRVLERAWAALAPPAVQEQA